MLGWYEPVTRRRLFPTTMYHTLQLTVTLILSFIKILDRTYINLGELFRRSKRFLCAASIEISKIIDDLGVGMRLRGRICTEN